MKKRICFWDVENGIPEVGYRFHLVETYFENEGRTRMDGRTAPQRTNMSGEERTIGWLGTTNNVNKSALGIYQVDEVLSGEPPYFQTGVLVKYSKID